MKENFVPSLKKVLEHEGGFVNHPQDPGGMTNLGVTKRVWEEWVGHPVDEKEMRSLTPEKIGPMYKKRYWDAIQGDELPAGVDYVVFDFAVNGGPGRATKILQSAIGAAPDGKIGPLTMAALRKANPQEVITNFTVEREKFYKSLPTFATFGKGWLRRTDESKISALTMLA